MASGKWFLHGSLPVPFFLKMFPIFFQKTPWFWLLGNAENPTDLKPYWSRAGLRPPEELERKYKDAILNKDLQLLPAPFGLRSKVQSDCKIQIVLSGFAEGSYIIIKHIIFPQESKLSVVKKLVYGTVYRPLFMHVPTVGRKILQYCLHNMGCTHLRCFDLAADAPTAKTRKVFDDLEDEGLDQGFDFILKHAPRSFCDLAQLRWQTKELRKSTSPIFGWPQNLVQQALRQLSSEGALARKEFAWPLPLTPMFFQPWLLEILESIWNFDLSALVMLGEPACGKSPLGRSVLMAQCRFNKKKYQVDGEPCIRCSPEIDFLRGEAGTVLTGDFLDDPCTQSLGLKALKSLLDVGLYESMSWAGWGAVKWVQNQPRALAANAYEAGVDEGESFILVLKFETFWEMVRPCLCKEATKADVDAILKRATFLVNTKQFVYYRKNGVNDDQVPRKCIPGADYLTDEGKKWYGKFKNNVKDPPPASTQKFKRNRRGCPSSSRSFRSSSSLHGFIVVLSQVAWKESLPGKISGSPSNVSGSLLKGRPWRLPELGALSWKPANLSLTLILKMMLPQTQSPWNRLWRRWWKKNALTASILAPWSELQLEV